MEPYLAGLGGKSPYPRLERYWQDPSRFPYLLYLAEKVIGFALVDRLDDDPTYELVEFYIAQEFRGKGLGREAALQLFGSYRARWSVGVRSDNSTGQAFWEAFFKGLPSVARSTTSAPDGVIYKFTSATNEA